MKRKLLFFAPLVALFVIAGFLHFPKPHGAYPGFAVVELFTSEGCSSCPPADAILGKMATAYNNVYVLGYHVNYWDKLGWKDVYSNADFTARQIEYGHLFKLNSIYTPQAVVSGGKELVGSNEAGLRSDILDKLKGPAGKEIKLHAASDGKNIKVDYQLTDAGTDVLHIALVQSHAESIVKAGENDGRTLSHVNVVRDLRSAPAGASGSVEFQLPAGLGAKDCKVIAFLQEDGGKGLAINGAAEAAVE